MEQMYQDYKDIAEFRMIYIREAHAVDGDRPNRRSAELGIKEHTSLEERCTTAQRLLDDKSLTMPMLVDSMDNATNLAYSAQPDRVFLVRSDGRLAVAADKGPRGFSPALNDVEAWLAEFKASGEQPSLDEYDARVGATATMMRDARNEEMLANDLAPLAGTWVVTSKVDGVDATTNRVVVTANNSDVSIVIGASELPGLEFAARNISFDGEQLSFWVRLQELDGVESAVGLIHFAGQYNGEKIVGNTMTVGDGSSVIWTRE